MDTYPCSGCGRDIAPATRCPHCGALQGEYAEELARVEQAIAEMKARDAAIANEQKTIAANLQAALFQRDILAHANAESLRRETRPRRTLRPKIGRRPPTAGRTPRWAPGQTSVLEEDLPPQARPEPEPDEPQPEASSDEIQNVLLGLSALVLAVAAVVFVNFAVSAFDLVSRMAILAIAITLTLAAAPALARRSLISTAETVAGIGLLLVPLTGYSVWSATPAGLPGLGVGIFGALVFAATALAAGCYARFVPLSVPRYATVLAVQPVLPLLVYDRLDGNAGWALAFVAVAAVNLYLGWLLARHGGLTWQLPPIGRARPATGGTEAGPVADSRPESAPEEDDAVVVPEGMAGSTKEAGADHRPEAVGPWLRDLIWTLHVMAVGAGLLYAVLALLGADTVPEALPAALALLLAAGVGLAGALTLRRFALADLAAGVLTLAVIGSLARVAALALPGRALLLVSAVVTVTGLGVRALPAAARRGPQIASAAALTVLGVLVAGSVLRAALAPVRAAQPIWAADLAAHPETLAAAAGPVGWQLAVSALLLTVAAVLALPPEARRGSAVAGVALAALAVPASFALPWFAAPWPPLLAAAGIGVAGLFADTERAAYVHVIGAAVVGFAGAGAALARPGLTAAALTALTATGVLIALAGQLPDFRARPTTDIVTAWATGGAAFALPGAVAALVTAAMSAPPGPPRAAAVPVLAASFLAVCAALGYTALTQVAQRQVNPAVTAGTGLGALVVAGIAFGASGAGLADAWVGALLLVSAVMIFLSPAIDAGRRADRLLDGCDFAAAAATAALAGTLARIAAVVAPGVELAASAALVLLVAVGVRALPVEWRRGPVLGASVSGGLVAVIAGYWAIGDALRALAMPGSLWHAELDAWPSGPGPGGWQVPAALALLAVAAAVLLPRPWSYDVSSALATLATVGAPVALGLPWWSPILVCCVVSVLFALAAVTSADPRAALSRVVVAAAVALYAVGAGLVRPWATALALAVVTALGVVVAALARVIAGLSGTPDEAAHPELMPPHLAQIGGAATAGALLALPGAVAALGVGLGWSAAAVLTGALVASCAGVAVLALVRPAVSDYLPYATAGIAGGAAVTAIAALPTALPAALYAAAAVLLAVVAELLRAHTPPPGGTLLAARHWSISDQAGQPSAGLRAQRSWWISPEKGVVAAAAVPTVLAAVTLAPALLGALVSPYGTLGRIWQGPPPELLSPPEAAVNPTNLLAAVLLTLAVALAATGFTGGRISEAVPVVLPGIAVTLLITPISLNLPWPQGTVAALAVFTITMVGLALTPPPPDSERGRPVRIARTVGFAIGLAAGGAGLAGSLATPQLTLVTLGGAVAVGGVAAFLGRSQRARILGWLLGAVMAQLFVLTVGLLAGAPRTWSAFGVLAVGAILLIVSARLPRLLWPEASREATVVEWTGYAAALLTIALAYDSTRHVAALLAAWGAVLGVVATRPGRHPVERRVLFWSAVGCEVVAWWMLMAFTDVALAEAYTLPFAALALLVGMLELRDRPDLSSWTAYGPALLAAFVPSLVLVLGSDTNDLRQILLLLGALATLLIGSMRQQKAPVVVGAIVTVVTTLHMLMLVGPWLALIPVGIVLLTLGATNERRRRTQERVRGALRGMR